MGYYDFGKSFNASPKVSCARSLVLSAAKKRTGCLQEMRKIRLGKWKVIRLVGSLSKGINTLLMGPQLVPEGVNCYKKSKPDP